MDEVMKPKLASWMEIRSERKNYSWNIVRPKARAEARGVGGIGSGEEGHHEADNRHSSTRLVGWAISIPRLGDTPPVRGDSSRNLRN